MKNNEEKHSAFAVTTTATSEIPLLTHFEPKENIFHCHLEPLRAALNPVRNPNLIKC